MPRPRPHEPPGDDEGESSSSPGDRSRPHGGSENVAAAERTTSAQLTEGRPTEAAPPRAASAEGPAAAFRRQLRRLQGCVGSDDSLG